MGILNLDRVRQMTKEQELQQRKEHDLDQLRLRHSKDLDVFVNEALDEFARAINTLHLPTKEIAVAEKCGLGKTIITKKVQVRPFTRLRTSKSFNFQMTPEQIKRFDPLLIPITPEYNCGYIDANGNIYLLCQYRNSVKVRGGGDLYLQIDRKQAIDYLFEHIYWGNREPKSGLSDEEQLAYEFDYRRKVISDHLEDALTWE